MKMPRDPKKLFLYFIHERESIRLQKEKGSTAPWTKDPILGKYRFCNVNREDDRVTRWIKENIRKVGEKDPDLWFALIVARLINQPSTLGRIYDRAPGPRGGTIQRIAAWNKPHFLKATDPDVHPKPIFNVAYIVSTNGVTMQKNEYVARMVLDPIWKASRNGHRPDDWDSSCSTWADWLLQFQGMGDFMVNQIVTDYKYTDICREAWDWNTFVMAGPGTRRGLNRYFGKDTNISMNREEGQKKLLAIRKEIRDDCAVSIRNIFEDLNNLSNCFCEFDKYMRAMTGEGAPKQRYTPGEEKLI